MVADLSISIIAILLQVFFGILLAIISIYLALRFFDKMTENVDEIKELKKGNIAVAIILLAMILSIGTIINQGVQQFDNVLLQGVSLPYFVIAFVMAIVQLVVVIAIAILTMYVSIVLLDSMTIGIEEMKEIRKGNVAVALVIAGVIYIVSFIVANALIGLSSLSIFRPDTLAGLLGVH